MKRQCILPIELMPEQLAVLYSQEGASEVCNDKPCDSLKEAEQVTNVPSELELAEEQPITTVTEAPTVTIDEQTGCISDDTKSEPPRTDELSNNIPCDSTSTESAERTNAFGTGTISPPQPVVSDDTGEPASILEFPSISIPATDDEEQSEKNVETKADQPPIRLENPKGQHILEARANLMEFINGPDNSNTERRKDLLNELSMSYIDAFHLNTKLLGPVDDLPMLSTDFDTIVAIIKKARSSVGIGELGISILVANATSDPIRLMKSKYKSAAGFYKALSDEMGISSSAVRDYVKRGRVFIKYREDFLNGVGKVPGISIQELASSYMAKVTIYDKVANVMGREQALFYLTRTTFAQFQKMSSENYLGAPFIFKSPSPLRLPRHSNLEKSRGTTLWSIYREVPESDLKPNEKRLLMIISKGGIPVKVPRLLTEKEVKLIENRLREERVKALEKNYRSSLKEGRVPLDPEHPIPFNDELYQMTDFSEIVLRIREASKLLQPLRRLIAILMYRLYSEKRFYSKWTRLERGGDNQAFRYFAIEKLGMGEDYRVYLEVGKVIKEHYRFLEYLTDIDTEETFLKLRWLPDALKTHQNNEPLVLARLCSLTIREWKIFSIYPDFETTFTKRLTQKRKDDFYRTLELLCVFNLEKGRSWDHIEAYNKGEEDLVQSVVGNFMNEVSLSSTVDDHNTSDQEDGITCADVPEALDDNSDQQATVMVS